ncbi:MAG: hypothetical protein FWH03_00865 [Firmicutes bacterium]|nr:hypothetical protein [Bacillota bacterium]
MKKTLRRVLAAILLILAAALAGYILFTAVRIKGHASADCTTHGQRSIYYEKTQSF